MALLIPDEGKVALLNIFLALEADLTLRLFQNNYTPVAGSEFADFTEATFSGYAAQALSNMAAAAIVLGKAVSTGDPLTFQHDGGGTGNSVYGWYLTYDPGAGDVVLMADRLGTPPKSMASNGNTIELTPTLAMNLGP